jgi:hypothetical protein
LNEEGAQASEAKRNPKSIVQSEAKHQQTHLYIASRCVRPAGLRAKQKPQQEQQQNMAIFHLHAQVIKRSEGRSSVAAHCYRLGVALERSSLSACAMISAAKGGVSGSLTLAPDNAPAGIGPGSVVGQCGDHRSAKTLNFAASSTFALPRELPPAVCHAGPCVRQKEFVDRGMCATIAFHHIGGDNPIST